VTVDSILHQIERSFGAGVNIASTLADASTTGLGCVVLMRAKRGLLMKYVQNSAKCNS